MSSTIYTNNYVAPNTYYSWTGANTENEVGSPITLPSAGYVSEIWIHCAGYNATAYAYHALWDNSGNLLGNSATMTWANSATRSWVGATGLNIRVPSSGTYWVGFWANPSYARQWSEGNISTTNQEYRVTATSSIGSLTGGSYTNGQNRVMCAYVVFNPLSANIWDGTSWVQSKSVQVWAGSSWSPAKAIYIWNGSAWVQNK